MAWKTKWVYVLTAFFSDDSYSDPSEEFFAETWEDAVRTKAELLEDEMYDDVIISDDKEAREFWEEDKIKGKNYEFILGVIGDESVEAYRELVKEYCVSELETGRINQNAIGYKIAIGERKIDDELLFSTAIYFATEHLKQLKVK